MDLGIAVADCKILAVRGAAEDGSGAASCRISEGADVTGTIGR